MRSTISAVKRDMLSAVMRIMRIVIIMHLRLGCLYTDNNPPKPIAEFLRAIYKWFQFQVPPYFVPFDVVDSQILKKNALAVDES